MRVPKREQTFITDQRAIRNMHIGKLDRKVSKANKRKHYRENQLLKRKEEEKRQRFEREKQLLSFDSELTFAVDIDATGSCSCNDRSIFIEELSNLLHEDRNVKPISTIALEADRFDGSNRTASAISTAALIDFGVVSAGE